MGEAAMTWEAPVGLEAEVTRLRRGDPEALTALLARYQNRLYRYLLRLVREPAAAEDLFQQTWLRVVERIRRYDPRLPLVFTFLFFAVCRYNARRVTRRNHAARADHLGGRAHAGAEAQNR